MKTLTHPYRAFISFSTEDRDKLEVVAAHLRELGLQVRWSGTLLPGMRFSEQIKDGIASAHLFVPILTKSASERPWVHHEIGYAIGLNVPVLPLALGDLPRGMVEELQAVSVSPDLSDLGRQLTPEFVQQLATLAPEGDRAVFQHAEYHEDRTRMLIHAARKVLQIEGPARVRQIGAFSSFSLPDATAVDPIWTRCDGKGPARSLALRRDLSWERRLLEDHAQAGCDLIIDPGSKYGMRGPAAERARLEILVKFLQSMPDDRVRVVLADASHQGNALILGDWFLAESITPMPARGYVQTLGTWHAPTVLMRLREFDRTFDLSGCWRRRASMDRLPARWGSKKFKR